MGEAVSRETADRLARFHALLTHWNRKINLISPRSLGEAWTRHIDDSVQVFDLAAVERGHWADLGTGGGFPGLVVAILAAERAPGLTVTCVDSDARKAAFLSEAVRALGLKARVVVDRIESLPPLQADVVSARALAPLPALLRMAARHLKPDGLAIFPKGAGVEAELAQALAEWEFSVDKVPSRTDAAASILKLRQLRPRNPA